MKKKRFSTEQISAVLDQAEQGIPVGDLCRQVGISEQSFYRKNPGRSPRPVGDHDHAAIATADGALSPRYRHRQPLQMVL